MKGDGFHLKKVSSALGGTIGKFKTMEGQVSMAAIVGETTSTLGGGKFANGAVGGAFVHMYNYTAHLPKWMPEAGNRAEQEYTSLKVMNSVSRFFLYAGDVIGEAFNGGLNGYRDVRDNSPMIPRYMLKGAMTAVELGLTSWIKDPVLYIYVNVNSGVMLDTIPYTNPVSAVASEVYSYTGNDNRWFK